MMAEMKQAKRFLGAKFGYGEPLIDGVYAIPTDTSKGPAFMKMEIKNGEPAGNDNFKLYWDEELKISWYTQAPPEDLPIETKFSKAFRKLEAAV